MRQTVITIASDVQPRSVAALKACIGHLRASVEAAASPTGATRYRQFGSAIPGLHFASIMVFEDERYDPLLTVELNFDGETGSFLPLLESSPLEPYLRQMVRCCKCPLGSSAALYKAVTDPDSKVPLTPYLESCVVRPAVFHQGNRGLDRNRILKEELLFADVQRDLEGNPAYGALVSASALHLQLRAALRGRHPWLDEAAPQRWTAAERRADILRLVAFLVAVLVCLQAPGMVLALLMPGWVTVLGCWLLAAALASVTRRMSPPVGAEPDPPMSPALPIVAPMPGRRKAAIAAGVVAVPVVYIVLLGIVLALPLIPFHFHHVGRLVRHAIGISFIGVLTVPLPVAAIVYWLRWLEQRDPTQADPLDDPQRLRAIAAREDKIAQNHMGSIVVIKPGLLRAVLVRVGLWGLGLALRALLTSGYLGSMRTIHFAHWAILSNGGRLAFFSNFDSSWASYLDDFIEKAHKGLTLAWTNAVGFPPTRFLIFDGATAGRLFKVWARHSMAENLFWFSAYKDLTVNQIERQWRIANGLRRATLTTEEADAWARDL